ncbi:MAG: hypothetical protein CM15mP4_1920 [Candidatus Neomarinimicrobiota bacterium]|nr:MAG: hypothetical protein CM15mP4_1920 [Candidatus Neomarinimicrobiota bacterium]
MDLGFDGWVVNITFFGDGTGFGGLLRLTVGENGYNSTFFELGGWI